MTLLKDEIFICLDCETTGLCPVNDRIIEVAIVKFTLEEEIERYETLIDPECVIPQSSTDIHNITQDMVQNKPKIHEVLPLLLQKIGSHIIVGHGIQFDLNILHESAKRHQVPNDLSRQKKVDTLRLARLYGESETNSLQGLRAHFNIDPEKAHRAMDDVLVNIPVFKKLSLGFKTTKDLLTRLEKPIYLKVMPLGKHKGRPFSEIPIDYLKWASRQDFDIDLKASIEKEIRARKKTTPFGFAANPFREIL